MRSVMQVVAALLIGGLALGCQTTHDKAHLATQEPLACEPRLPVLAAPNPRVISCPGRLDTTIVFQCGSVAFDEGGKRAIGYVQGELKRFPKDTVTVVGHTCDLGSPNSNYLLGLKRALAVRRALIDSGISPWRVFVESRGDTRPRVPNNSEPNRSLNRRVEFEMHAVD